MPDPLLLLIFGSVANKWDWKKVGVWLHGWLGGEEKELFVSGVHSKRNIPRGTLRFFSSSFLRFGSWEKKPAGEIRTEKKAQQPLKTWNSKSKFPGCNYGGKLSKFPKGAGKIEIEAQARKRQIIG